MNEANDKLPTETERPKAVVMQRVVRWLARLVDEQPDWFKALLAIVAIYIAVRGYIMLGTIIVWLVIKASI